MENGGRSQRGPWWAAGRAGAAWGCALLLALFLLPHPAAAGEPRFARGSWEYGTRVSPSGLPAPTLGYFLADRVELVAHFADSVLTSLDAELPESSLLRHREVQLDAAVSVPAAGPLAPCLGVGGRFFSRHEQPFGAPARAAQGTDLHALAGVRVLVGRIASVNVLVRAGTRRLDDPLTGASRDGAFADLAISLSRFF